jgi:sugar phosphate isomerase/epimerase
VKLAISNIAWGRRSDDELLAFLKDGGADAVELAPGLLDAAVSGETATRLQRHGLDVVGLHSLLFEVQHLRVVREAHHAELLEYCCRLAKQCRRLGGNFLVFGSPGSRSLDGLDHDSARPAAEMFFRALAAIGVEEHVTFLIEPLPGADLIRNHRDGIDLVEAIASAGLSLHMDTRTMTVNGDAPETVAEQAAYLKHVHSGGADLSFASPEDGTDHAAFAAALKAIGYDGFVTLEMVRASDAPDFDRLAASLKFAREVYCS